ncbi:MAG: S8 family serine peptidase [Caldilineaceae bacterium]|nr:S8 family serine peptidase [Caldilineaceae bacterium]MBP8106299.1 S8 family serine peptidase [Caldilineaceae bacterium]MBP8125733.1 S8 family serine peptidase [Caldilineaceae bacterium]MBP9071145.1 S8 family serine peptidase [Caldilineaceae bacterium]
MHRRKLLFLLSTLIVSFLGFLLAGGLMWTGTLAALAQAADPQSQSQSPSELEPRATTLTQGYAAGYFVPGEILVGVSGPAISEAQAIGPDAPVILSGLMAQVGATLADPAVLPPLSAQEWAEASGMVMAAAQMDGSVTVQLWRVEPGQEVAALTFLAGQPDLVFAEPNGVVWAAELPAPIAPTDPLYDSYQWGMQRINVSRAWTLSKGGGVRVAVIDSGIDLTHPEFAGRIIASKNYVVPSQPAQDDNGHGTHVAGIIAAGQSNGVGVTGVAPDVQLDIRRVLSNGPGGLTGSINNLADAIFEAANDGAKVINLSVESPVSSTVLSTAINLAASRGVLLVAAAGNTGGAVQWPAAYANVMAVAAMDRFDRHAFYSSQGPEIEIAAPGGLVQASTIPPVNDPILSTWAAGTLCNQVYQVQSSYCNSIGTSMATPFVSGTAALIRGLRPDLTATQVRQILRETAVPLTDGVQKVGSGRVDAQAALRRAMISNLVLVPSAAALILPPGETMPRTATVMVTNPSTDPIAWQVTGTSPTWLTVTGATSGTSRFDRPGQISLAISPTGLITGTHTAQVTFSATRSNGDRLTFSLDVSVMINGAPDQVYLPLILARYTPSDSALVWETPGSSTPITLTMFAGSSNGFQLPFTMTLKGASYNYARLSANGLIYLQNDPSDPLVSASPNRCFSDIDGTDWLHKAIAGWWAELDPSQGSVRTFQPDGESRWVIEFDRVASSGVSPVYTVSFQMVLYPNGSVRLNYRDVPTTAALGNIPVTVGMIAKDGLLYNQIACITASTRLGQIPLAGTSVWITGSGLY